MSRIYAIDELYRALALVHETIPWIPDSLQDKLVEAERLMQSGLGHLEGYLGTFDLRQEDICYTCKYMCDIRRKYIGAKMMQCVRYEERK